MVDNYNQYYAALGDNIHMRRRAANLTQQQLAEMVNVDFTHVSKIELGKNKPSLRLVFAIADALKVHPSKLLEPRE